MSKELFYFLYLIILDLLFTNIQIFHTHTHTQFAADFSEDHSLLYQYQIKVAKKRQDKVLKNRKIYEEDQKKTKKVMFKHNNILICICNISRHFVSRPHDQKRTNFLGLNFELI